MVASLARMDPKPRRHSGSRSHARRGRAGHTGRCPRQLRESQSCGGRAGIESPGKTDLYQVVCGRRGISTLVPLLPASHRRKLLDYVSLRTTITGRVTSTTGDQTTMTFRTFLLSACLLFFGSATVSAETLKIGLNYP